MNGLPHILSQPVAILVAALAVIWIARRILSLAFRVVLIFAVVGAGAIASGAQLPTGIHLDSLAATLQQDVGQAVGIAREIFRTGGIDAHWGQGD